MSMAKVESESKEKPKPPTAGIVYGEAAYWLAIIGMIVSIAGLGIYLSVGSGVTDAGCLLAELLKGTEVNVIWEKCSGIGHTPHGHWYLGFLSTGEGIAMLGIAICCIAGLVGIWGTFGLLLHPKSKEYVYAGFALLVGIILVLCMLGIIAVEH